MRRLFHDRRFAAWAVLALVIATTAIGCAGPRTWNRQISSATAATLPEAATPYNLDQAISDKAQLNTIAFDGIGFLTGTIGSDSFFPPGKVADFWGFQYLRDNDPSEMGHNTDFLTRAALNMYTVLNADQRAQLKTLATGQVAAINEYGYKRFVLMKAFRRQLEGDLPTGSTGLSESAVRAYSAELYRLDGEISYERAAVMGPILESLSTTQCAYLDAMVGKGMLDWPNVTEPDDMRSLSRDEKVAVMTYSGDLFSWYAGDVEADVYFCPERHGTYFGSFYLKDAPAVGNPGYSIPTTMTGQMGENFLATLSDVQRAQITGIIAAQKPDLLGIVDARRAVSQQLRGFRGGSAPTTQTIGELMTTYGDLDGALSYRYVTAFTNVAATLSDAQKATIQGFRTEMIGDRAPSGAYLYSQEIAMPDIPDTDFLFEMPEAPITANPVSGFTARAQSGAVLLGWTSPGNGFDSVRILRSTSSYATTATPTTDQAVVYEGEASSYRATGLTNGSTYYFTAFARGESGVWSEATTASATPRATTYLSLRRSRSGAKKGLAVRLTAVVYPQAAAPGRRVYLQRKTGGTWKSVASIRMTSNRATFVRRDRTSGYFRVHMDTSAKYSAATSAATRIRRW